ncbi:MAG: DUF4369 domain-containing protein [Bacteroidales bacterium]|nr:DUF4369 domain-containing protein [Bacteroidales bacterium]
MVAAIMTLSLASCGDDENFRIQGEVAGGGGQMIDFIYYARGAMQRVSVPAEGGKFILQGQSSSPTLGFLYLSGSTPLATIVVENGDNIECKLSAEDPLAAEVKGNKTSSAVADFLHENADAIRKGDVEAVNQAIAKYVGSHPKSMASTVLMVTRFSSEGYEKMADSLMSLIPLKARPTAVVQGFNTVMASLLSTEANAELQSMGLYDRRDTIIRYMPRQQSLALFAFVGPERSQRDTIVPSLRALSDTFPKRRLKVMEISTALDSARWRQSVDGDSASWVQAWTPGSVASSAFRKMAVPRVPFFIVADSTGSQIYRGGSIEKAKSLINRRLKGS